MCVCVRVCVAGEQEASEDEPLEPRAAAGHKFSVNTAMIAMLPLCSLLT